MTHPKKNDVGRGDCLRENWWSLCTTAASPLTSCARLSIPHPDFALLDSNNFGPVSRFCDTWGLGSLSPLRVLSQRKPFQAHWFARCRPCRRRHSIRWVLGCGAPGCIGVARGLMAAQPGLAHVLQGPRSAAFYASGRRQSDPLICRRRTCSGPRTVRATRRFLSAARTWCPFPVKSARTWPCRSAVQSRFARGPSSSRKRTESKFGVFGRGNGGCVGMSPPCRIPWVARRRTRA